MGVRIVTTCDFCLDRGKPNTAASEPSEAVKSRAGWLRINGRWQCPKCKWERRKAETIQRVMDEIRKDVEKGLVPGSVRSFSELHNHVDANTYGGSCDPDGPNAYDGTEECTAFWNSVQNVVDAWLTKGGADKRRWVTEFGGLDYDCPPLPDGWEDVSWRQDAAPSYKYRHFRVWLEHPHENMREIKGEHRFCVWVEEEGHPRNGDSVFLSNDWDRVVTYVRSHAGLGDYEMPRVTRDEFDAILCGLRLLQKNLADTGKHGLPEMLLNILTNDGEHEPLTSSLLDALCEKLNTK